MNKITAGLGAAVLALAGCSANPMKDYYGIDPAKINSKISEQKQTIEGKIKDVQYGFLQTKSAGTRMYKYLDIETKDNRRYWLLCPDTRPFFKGIEAKITFKEIFDGKMSTNDFKKFFMMKDDTPDEFPTIITAKGLVTGVEYEK